MPNSKNAKADKARALYEKQGWRLVDIAKKLDCPPGTVRRWKSEQKWNEPERSVVEAYKKKQEAKKRPKIGAPLGNKNAVGNRGGKGAPPGNQRAVRWGLLSRYIPKETMELMRITAETSPLELLWDQIQIAYAAIMRAQQIMYVRDHDDMSVTQIKEGHSSTGSSEEQQVQYAWDKQAAFLKAQSRAQSELRSMMKQYDELLHKDWETATEEQKARLEVLRSKLNTTGSDVQQVTIINDTKQKDGPDQ